MNTYHSYQGNGSYLFACYSHDDSEEVLNEIGWLQGGGVNIWYDEGIRAGVDWQDEIAAKISAASGLLFFGSPAAISSQFCLNELYYAMGLNKPILSLYDDKLELPPGLALSLGSRQALFRADLARETFFEKLKQGCELLLAGEESGPPSAPRKTDRSSPMRSLGRWVNRFVDRARQQQETLAQPHVPDLRGSDCSEKQPAALEQSIIRLMIVPFQALGGDEELNDTAVGLVSDMITIFARNPQFAVVSRRTVFKLDPDADYLSAARAENAHYLVEGAIRVQSSEIRIGLELIEVGSGTPVWSRSFVEEREKVMDIQGQFIRAMAQYLGPAVWRSEGYRVSRQQPSNLTAWQLVHRADYVELTPGSGQAAEALVKQALDEDPDYAPALSSMSRIIANRVLSGHSRTPRVLLDEANGLAERAMLLSPMDPQILLNTSIVKGASNEVSEAISLVQRALSIDPLITGGLGYLGSILIHAGQVEEGIQAIEREIDQDPDTPRLFLHLSNLAMGYERIGNLEKAASLMLEAAQLNPQLARLWLTLAILQAQLGQVTAITSFQKARELLPHLDREGLLSAHMTLYRNSGDHGVRVSLFEELWAKTQAP